MKNKPTKEIEVGTQKSMNTGKQKLSISELGKFNGLENLTDEEADEIIDGLFKFSHITYKIYKNGLKNVNEVP